MTCRRQLRGHCPALAPWKSQASSPRRLPAVSRADAASRLQRVRNMLRPGADMDADRLADSRSHRQAPALRERNRSAARALRGEAHSHGRNVMAEAGTLHDAFIDELRDTYDAEKQLTKALAKLAKAASNPKLRQAFESHLEETQGQIERLEQVFESLDEKPRGKHCDGIAGIIEEGKAIMEEEFDETTMDACLMPPDSAPSTTKWRPTARWSLGRGRWATPGRRRCCSRRWTKRKRPTRSCRAWPR